MVPYLQIFAPCAALWWFYTYQNHLPKLNMSVYMSVRKCQNMSVFVKFKKPSETAVVLIAGVTISGTPWPRHIIVPFGAEAPSGHVAQAWAIPPPSWGLLSQRHRQQTTTPETNEASSPEPSDILKRFYALYDNNLRYFKKKVSKLYYLFNPFVPTALYKGALKLAKIAEKTPALIS